MRHDDVTRVDQKAYLAEVRAGRRVVAVGAVLLSLTVVLGGLVPTIGVRAAGAQSPPEGPSSGQYAPEHPMPVDLPDGPATNGPPDASVPGEANASASASASASPLAIEESETQDETASAVKDYEAGQATDPAVSPKPAEKRTTSGACRPHESSECSGAQTRAEYGRATSDVTWDGGHVYRHDCGKGNCGLARVPAGHECAEIYKGHPENGGRLSHYQCWDPIASYVQGPNGQTCREVTLYEEDKGFDGKGYDCRDDKGKGCIYDSAGQSVLCGGPLAVPPVGNSECGEDDCGLEGVPRRYWCAETREHGKREFECRPPEGETVRGPHRNERCEKIYYFAHREAKPEVYYECNGVKQTDPGCRYFYYDADWESFGCDPGGFGEQADSAEPEADEAGEAVDESRRDPGGGWALLAALLFGHENVAQNGRVSMVEPPRAEDTATISAPDSEDETVAPATLGIVLDSVDSAALPGRTHGAGASSGTDGRAGTGAMFQGPAEGKVAAFLLGRGASPEGGAYGDGGAGSGVDDGLERQPGDGVGGARPAGGATREMLEPRVVADDSNRVVRAVGFGPATTVLIGLGALVAGGVAAAKKVGRSRA